MNETIFRFLQEQTCSTICCVDDQGNPYCFNCFYAFNAMEGLLYFKSSAGSKHSALMKIVPSIAGTIFPDKLNKLQLKGVQFEGQVLDAGDLLVKQGLSHYLKQHPMALAIPGELWAIRVDHIKMTDSTLGFGKKISWTRGEIL